MTRIVHNDPLGHNTGSGGGLGATPCLYTVDPETGMTVPIPTSTPRRPGARRPTRATAAEPNFEVGYQAIHRHRGLDDADGADLGADAGSTSDRSADDTAGHV